MAFHDNLLKRIDKDLRFKNAAAKPSILINSDILNIQNYLSLPLEKRFAKLMTLYDVAQPRWVAEFNALEEKKPHNMQIRLDPQTTTMEDFIESADNDELCQTVMAMYTANKLAHVCENTRRVLLEKYLKQKLKDVSSPQEEDLLKGALYDFENISHTLKTYFDPRNSTKPGLLRKLEYTLNINGISSKDLESFSKNGFKQLVEKEKIGYYLKDFEMLNLIDMLKERDDISYGMVTENKISSFGTPLIDKKTGQPQTSHLLVVDLPYYGQFSVHMKEASSISALSQTPYSKLRVFETESMILTSEVSPYAEKDLDNGSISMEKLKKIKNRDPRYAHYLALKTGATKDELEELHSDR